LLNYKAPDKQLASFYGTFQQFALPLCFSPGLSSAAMFF
jgi:hypothetical protein